jgi:hypothetical protein
MKIEQKEKSFVFLPSTDTLMAFKDASAEDKLNWLEEANQFVNDFVSPEKLDLWKRISGR